MNKDELIELLRTHKQTSAKRDLNLNDIGKIKRDIKKIENDYSTNITPTYQEGSKSNEMSSKVESAVIRKDTRIIEKEEIIRKLEEENEDLNYILNQVNIRLGSLTYIEKTVLTSRYIDEMEYDYIGNKVFYEIKHQTRGEDAIKKICKKSTEKWR